MIDWSSTALVGACRRGQHRGGRRGPHARQPVRAAVVHVRRRGGRRRRRSPSAWCGDSRAYWLPDAGDGEQLTVDHSLGTEMIAAGQSGPRPRPTRRRTRSPAGSGPTRSTRRPEVASRRLDGPGWVLVCSDGLWNYASTPDALAALVAEAAPPPPVAGHADPVAVGRARSSTGPTSRAATTTSPPPWPAATRRYADPSHARTTVREESPTCLSSRPSVPERVPRRRRHRRARRRLGHVQRRRHGRADRARRRRRGDHRRHVRLDGHAADEDRGGAARRQGRRSSEIVDGTWFAVISGHSVAQMVLPAASRHGQDDARPPGATRSRPSAACAAAGRRRSGRGSPRATELFDQAPAGAAPRHPAHRRQDRGRAAERAATRRWPRPAASSSATAGASARTGWSTSCGTIADALLGTVDIVAEPDDLEADFEAMIRACDGPRRGRRPAAGVGAAGQRGAVRPPGRPGGRGPHAAAACRSARWSASSRPARGATRAATTTSPCGCRRRRSAASGWPRGSRSSSTTRCGQGAGARRCGAPTPT